MNSKISLIKTHVEDILSHDKSGHGYEHTIRVYKNALNIWKSEGGDKLVIELSSLLHDVDDYKLFGDEYANKLINANNILNKIDISKKQKKHVLHIIKNMSFSKSLNKINNRQTIEQNIVTDADRLDAIGSNGIIRSLQYNLSLKNPVIFDNKAFPEYNLTTEKYKDKNRKSNHFINHFFEKLLTIKDKIHTTKGRDMAQKRHDIMVLFLENYFIENNESKWLELLKKYKNV